MSMFRDGKKAVETQAVKAEPLADSRLGTTPICMNVPLTSLAPREYELQVTVLDTDSERFATWHACKL